MPLGRQLSGRSPVLAFALVVAAVGCHSRHRERTAPAAGHDPPDINWAPTEAQKHRDIAALPIGLRVTHTPNPVKAQVHGRSGQRYTWLYETRVEAISEDVQIVEFGALIRKPPLGNWELETIYKRPFWANEFTYFYDCPGAWVHVGTPCVDSSNYTGGDQVREFGTRWYYIGKTRSGQLVRGEETVDCTP